MLERNMGKSIRAVAKKVVGKWMNSTESVCFLYNLLCSTGLEVCVLFKFGLKHFDVHASQSKDVIGTAVSNNGNGFL